MYGIELILLLVALVLTADVGWSGFRNWRERHLAVKYGRTLTARFMLHRAEMRRH